MNSDSADGYNHVPPKADAEPDRLCLRAGGRLTTVEDVLRLRRTPLFTEIADWYDLGNGQNGREAGRIVRRLEALNEIPERVRSFLLGRERKPPLRFFLDDFLEWRQRNPLNITVSYQEYLHSEAWQKRRELHLKQAEYKCQLCNSPERLQVHHRSYERLGCERFADLIALCRACHAKHHNKSE